MGEARNNREGGVVRSPLHAPDPLKGTARLLSSVRPVSTTRPCVPPTHPHPSPGDTPFESDVYGYDFKTKLVAFRKQAVHTYQSANYSLIPEGAVDEARTTDLGRSPDNAPEPRRLDPREVEETMARGRHECTQSLVVKNANVSPLVQAVYDTLSRTFAARWMTHEGQLWMLVMELIIIKPNPFKFALVDKDQNGKPVVKEQLQDALDRVKMIVASVEAKYAAQAKAAQ